MKGPKLGRGLDFLLDKARGRLDNRAAAGAADGSGAGADAAVGDLPGDAPGSRPPDHPAPAPSDGDRVAGEEILRIPLGALRPNPQQPRATFGARELDSLKASISRDGILQPVLVRKVGDDYEIVAGERRYRAAQEAGLDTVPAIVVDVQDERMLELALVENLHRENLNPIETAKAFRGLLSLRGWTQEFLAENLGISRPVVSNTLRLLELPGAVQTALTRGQIQMGHAKILLSVSGATEQQQLFEKIAEDRLSVRELEITREAMPTRSRGSSDRRPKRRRRTPSASGKSPNVVTLEDELSQALGTKVTIQEKKGRGVIRLEFYGPEDFEHLRGLLLAGPSDA